LPGANSTSAARSTWTASGVHGMFAPSTTATTPFPASVAAAVASSSFCVAQGIATLIGVFAASAQMSPFARYSADGRWAAYSDSRARSISLRRRSSSKSMPSRS
jgi:hypothetical protein